jgi:hypothetical protein
VQIDESVSLPMKFTIQVLLLVQVILPERDGGEINIAGPTGRKKGKQEGLTFEQAAESFIKDNFTDWQVVWMGVEG